VLYDPTSRGAEAYHALAVEVAERLHAERMQTAVAGG
jgi:hypothetical protein